MDNMNYSSEQNSIAAAVNAAMSGNNEGFTYLYNSTYRKSYYTAVKYMKNEDVASDVVQEAYMRAFQNLSMLQDANKFSGWLSMIVANTAKNYLKKKNPVLFSEMDIDNGEDNTIEFEDTIVDEKTDFRPEEHYSKVEMSELVDELLNALPEEQKICMILYYLEGLSVEEIAVSLECNKNTVTSRLNYGRKKIRSKGEELEKRGYKLYSVSPVVLLALLLRTEMKSYAAIVGATTAGATAGMAAGTTSGVIAGTTAGAASGTTLGVAAGNTAGIASEATAGSAASSGAGAASSGGVVSGRVLGASIASASSTLFETATGTPTTSRVSASSASSVASSISNTKVIDDSELRRCPNCGNRVYRIAKFCPVCGADQNKPAALVGASKSAAKKGSAIKAFLSALLCLAVVAGGIGLFLHFGNKKDKKDDTHNLNNASEDAGKDKASKDKDGKDSESSVISTENSLADMADIYVGDIVNFGTPPTDSGYKGGTEKLSWYVLDIQDGYALLASRYNVYAIDEGNLSNWTDSHIREWMNNDFYNNSFNDTERALIRDTKLTFKNTGEAPCVDKIFAPSMYDVYSYFKPLDERGLASTNSGGYDNYYLRDFLTYQYENDEPQVYDVYGNDIIGFSSIVDKGYRAMMWVSLSGSDLFSVEYRPDYNKNKDEDINHSDIKRAQVGDTVEYGRFEQSKSRDYSESIKWKVLDRDGDKVLLISEDVIDYNYFDYTGNPDASWANSTLRRYMNSVFYSVAFTKQEQRAIAETHLSCSDDPESGESGGEDTVDKVFILDITEAEKYFDSDDSRMAKPTRVVINEAEYCYDYYYSSMEKDGFVGCVWWLRSAGNKKKAKHIDNFRESKPISVVYGFGFIYDDNGSRLVEASFETHGIRPAIWVDTSVLD